MATASSSSAGATGWRKRWPGPDSTVADRLTPQTPAQLLGFLRGQPAPAARREA